jgi:bla regulator protein BlaR1
MDSLAETVGWLFGWLLRNSAHAALLVVPLALLDRLLFRRLAPRWRYGLWLIVIVRLLVPGAPRSPLSLSNLVDLAPAWMAGPAHQILGLPTPGTSADSAGVHPLADTPAWFLVAFALWLPGAVTFACLLWRDHSRIRRALDATIPVGQSRANDLLQQCRGVMRVRWPVQLVETPLIGSPAIAGWWRPRVLLPTGLLARLSPDETRFLLLHELAHVKRADIALNWLLAAVQILHWFNPVIWYALRRLLAVREEVCDELVLRRSFPGASREYGLTLLRLLEECAPRRIVPALAGVLDDVTALRQRMRCIRDFGLQDPRPWLPAGVTVAVAIVGLTERPLPPQDPATHSLASARGSRALRHPGSLRPPAASNLPDAPNPAPRRRTPSARVIDALSTAIHEAASPAPPGVGEAGQPPEPVRPMTVAQPSGATAFAGAGRPGLAPVRLPVAPAPAGAGPRAVPSITRLYPLPPINQRGDILRPPKERP